MSKFWVSFAKYAGVEVEADTAEQAEAIALEVDENEFEYNPVVGDTWEVNGVEPVED